MIDNYTSLDPKSKALNLRKIISQIVLGCQVSDPLDCVLDYGNLQISFVNYVGKKKFSQLKFNPREKGGDRIDQDPLASKPFEK